MTALVMFGAACVGLAVGTFAHKHGAPRWAAALMSFGVAFGWATALYSAAERMGS